MWQELSYWPTVLPANGLLLAATGDLKRGLTPYYMLRQYVSKSQHVQPQPEILQRPVVCQSHRLQDYSLISHPAPVDISGTKCSGIQYDLHIPLVSSSCLFKWVYRSLFGDGENKPVMLLTVHAFEQHTLKTEDWRFVTILNTFDFGQTASKQNSHNSHDFFKLFETLDFVWGFEMCQHSC